MTGDNTIWTRLQSAVSDHKQTTEQRWEPAPGDSITGLIEQIVSHEGRRGPYRLIHIQLADQSVVTVSESKVIRDELAKHTIVPGDGIALTYHGERQSQRGATYKSYSVTVIPSDLEDGGDL